MAKAEFLIYGAILLIIIAFSEVQGLRCWTCSSQSEGHEEWCRDKLDQKKISASLYNTGLIYRECSTSTLDETRQKYVIPVCRKHVQKVEGKIIYQRHCDYVDERENDYEKCKYQETTDSIKIIECRDCRTDGCNSGNGLLPVLITIIMPVVIAKILMV